MINFKFSYLSILVIKVQRFSHRRKIVPAVIPALFKRRTDRRLGETGIWRSKEHVLVLLVRTRALASCKYPGGVHACTHGENTRPIWRVRDLLELSWRLSTAVQPPRVSSRRTNGALELKLTDIGSPRLVGISEFKFEKDLFWFDETISHFAETAA